MVHNSVGGKCRSTNSQYIAMWHMVKENLFSCSLSSKRLSGQSWMKTMMTMTTSAVWKRSAEWQGTSGDGWIDWDGLSRLGTECQIVALQLFCIFVFSSILLEENVILHAWTFIRHHDAWCGIPENVVKNKIYLNFDLSFVCMVWNGTDETYIQSDVL